MNNTEDLEFYPIESIEDIQMLCEYTESDNDNIDILRKSLHGLHVSGYLQNSSIRKNIKIQGKIVDTHFNIGGLRGVNVLVKNKDNILNDDFGVIGLGVHFINLKNITSIKSV